MTMIESVRYLTIEAIWSFVILLFFGVAGLGPLLLFKNLIRFRVLASPLAGVLLVTTATLAIYFIFHLGYRTATLCAAGLCLIASVVLCVAYGKNLSAKDVAISVAVLGIVIVCFAGLSNTAAIKNGVPSIMYFDGTDHLGYANVADWMRDHIGWPGIGVPGVDGPRADPAHPYESMPNIMLNSEPRNGAFGFLALIGLIRQLPSAFAYDPASGVFLAAAVLGVAAVFARTWLVFAILTLGLAFSSWYELSHAGFLGKAIAYPAILFCLGLFLISWRMNDLRVVLTVLILCASSALAAVRIGDCCCVRECWELGIANRLVLREISGLGSNLETCDVRVRLPAGWGIFRASSEWFRLWRRCLSGRLRRQPLTRLGRMDGDNWI
jgi:hypothetical protein